MLVPFTVVLVPFVIGLGAVAPWIAVILFRMWTRRGMERIPETGGVALLGESKTRVTGWFRGVLQNSQALQSTQETGRLTTPSFTPYMDGDIYVFRVDNRKSIAQMCMDAGFTDVPPELAQRYFPHDAADGLVQYRCRLVRLPHRALNADAMAEFRFHKLDLPSAQITLGFAAAFPNEATIVGFDNMHGVYRAIKLERRFGGRCVSTHTVYVDTSYDAGTKFLGVVSSQKIED